MTSSQSIGGEKAAMFTCTADQGNSRALQRSAQANRASEPTKENDGACQFEAREWCIVALQGSNPRINCLKCTFGLQRSTAAA